MVVAFQGCDAHWWYSLARQVVSIVGNFVAVYRSCGIVGNVDLSGIDSNDTDDPDSCSGLETRGIADLGGRCAGVADFDD